MIEFCPTLEAKMQKRGAGEYGCNAIEICVNGKKYPNIANAARDYGQKPSTVRSRLYQGWSLEEALEIESKPKIMAKANKKGTKIFVHGEEYKYIKDAAQKYNMSPQVVANRIKRGLTPEQALELEPFPDWFVPGKGNKKAMQDAKRAIAKKEQEDLTDSRICSTCKKQLPFTDFHGSREMKTLSSRCRHCISAAFLKYRYGMSIEDFEALRQKQNGQCEICLVKLEIHPDSSVRTKRVAIDHCHQTGVIRGLLCANCNTGLGMFKDNYKLLQAASEYLLKQQEGSC